MKQFEIQPAQTVHQFGSTKSPLRRLAAEDEGGSARKCVDFLLTLAVYTFADVHVTLASELGRRCNAHTHGWALGTPLRVRFEFVEPKRSRWSGSRISSIRRCKTANYGS